MDPPLPPSPMDSSSDDELELSLHRRDSVHYATIGEFLGSLRNVQNSALGVKSLGLEEYLRVVRCPEKQPHGDRDPVEASAWDNREQEAKD